MRRCGAAAAMAVALALPGCSSANVFATCPRPNPHVRLSQVPTPREVACLVGATDMTGTRVGENYAAQEALAIYKGQPVMIVTFTSEQNQFDWERTSGWMNSIELAGDKWVIRAG